MHAGERHGDSGVVSVYDVNALGSNGEASPLSTLKVRSLPSGVREIPRVRCTAAFARASRAGLGPDGARTGRAGPNGGGGMHGRGGQGGGAVGLYGQVQGFLGFRVQRARLCPRLIRLRGRARRARRTW